MRAGIYLLILLTGVALGNWRCTKYEDPPPTDGDERLTNHYCNDPRAINYNWGFPGIPDDSICIYPSDVFAGSWQFRDSVFLSDSTFVSYSVKDIIFQPTEDTALIHLSLSGWCGSKKLLVTADKFGHATLDSLPEGVEGQLLCAPTDTITGSFRLPPGIRDSLQVHCQVISTAGVQIHRGWAIRQ